MHILLLNAGSSSLKATLMSSSGEVVVSGQGDWAGGKTHYELAAGGTKQSHTVTWTGHAAAVTQFLGDLTSEQRASLTAVGHRVVHGGAFTASLRITDEVRERIQQLVELAPLHNPPSLAALAAAEAALPRIPHVAVFDTAFHATLPAEAFTYPVPAKWTREWGVRRYGFHGLSHAYCSRRAAEMLDGCDAGCNGMRAPSPPAPLPPGKRGVARDADAGLRVVVCHLGHGCSASAVIGGRCVDTTMGFTPLDGLMMATRSGAVDPSILIHVAEHHGLSPAQLETALNRESGLLGVSEVSADMREVLAAAASGNAAANLAIGIYTHRVRQAIGAFAVTMGGVDAVVFTAGVGEHSAAIRAAICEGLQCLGLHLDQNANTKCRPDADVATTDSPGRILVIATREDLTMLRDVLAVIGK